MKYFKNTELARIHNVSEKSVRNWIQASQEGKLDLQLHEHNGKSFVANTSKNSLVIATLVEKGKKYKNKRGFRICTPTQEFYEKYSQKQIIDILSNLTIHNEIPLQYSYVNGGAEYWDKYASRLSQEQTPNILNTTISLLKNSFANIDTLTKQSQHINVIDLGPGNGMPIRPVLEHLIKTDRLGRYIAIDNSPEILSIVKDNVRSWFGNKVAYEGHLRDFSYERFDDLLINDLTDDSLSTNLVFFLGGTLSNFRHPDRILQTINGSMGINDLLIYTGYLDTPRTRRYFDFDIPGDENYKLGEQEKLIPDYLNVEDSLYDVEQLFDEKKRERSMSIKPRVDISIEVKFPSSTRHVELQKNVPILVWRHKHYSAIQLIDLFDQNDFDLMQSMKSSNQDYHLLITRIKTSNSLR